MVRRGQPPHLKTWIFPTPYPKSPSQEKQGGEEEEMEEENENVGFHEVGGGCLDEDEWGG